MKKETEKTPTITNIIERIEEYLKQGFSKELLLKLEPQILELQSARLSLLFAENVPNAQVSAHQDIVMYCGKLQLQLDFALNVDGADVSLIGQNIVKEYKNINPSYIYDFLNDIDVEPMEAIGYMVEVWDQLNEKQRTTLYDMYVGDVYDTIFHQRLALKKEKNALQQIDEISNLIRTYQNQTKKA